MKAAALKRGRRVVSEDGPDPIDEHVGKRLRECRLQAGLSQAAVAEPLGLCYQVVQRYETGLIRISASTLYRLAQMLDIEPNYFFDGYAGPVALLAKKPKR
jgi:transcriptional regulator with XRE-family HTH domain